jgi:hypothetical protein
LTTDEVTFVQNAVAGYNAAIAGAVAQYPTVGLVDMNAVLAALPAEQKTHFVFLVNQGLDVATAAATTVFSLDGVHVNNKGYGVVANAFIDVINDLAGTAVAAVNLNGLVWDPTYANYQSQPIDAAARHDGNWLTPAAVAAIDGMLAR